MVAASGMPIRIISTESSGLATYSVAGTGYTAYATPTDLLTIRGSATKKVRIITFSLKITTTAGALQTMYWIKRSTANTGGTSTNPTGVPFDSTDVAATAQVDLYTAAPTLGTTLAVTFYQSILTTAPTAVPGNFVMSVGAPNTIDSVDKPIILNNQNEMMCANWNGVALPAGFTAQYILTWIEF